MAFRNEKKYIELYDTAVIGSGMAGMSASLFAVKQGLKTVQIGNVGGILYSPGVLDLISVYPIEEKRRWDNPWEAIDLIREKSPRHPYARLSNDEIKKSFDEFLPFLEETGMKYHTGGLKNLRLITAVGTIKNTYAVPESMAFGVEAYQKKLPTLFVDFQGLKEYSARQVVSTIGENWPGCRDLTIVFPGAEKKNELFAGHIARALELSAIREKMAIYIKPEIKNAAAVAFPAVLGIQRTCTIVAHLTKLLGVPVFEVPTMPLSVPGLRMKEAFDLYLSRLGVHRLVDKRVEAVVRKDDGTFSMEVGGIDNPRTIEARCIILATGRFMGKGLVADRGTIREPLFDLPLYQPEDRRGWHSDLFFDPKGHPVNRAGVEIDDSFRPIDKEGKVIQENLFAAGSVLAHQDWIRTKSGSGLALATAWGAVHSLSRYLSRDSKKD